MTCIDVACVILKVAGQPLHFDDITQRTLAQKLIAPPGLIPDATIWTTGHDVQVRFCR